MMNHDWLVTVFHDVLGLDTCRCTTVGHCQATRITPYYSRFWDKGEVACHVDGIDLLPAYESIILEDRFSVRAPKERWAVAKVMVGHYAALVAVASRELGAPAELDEFWSGDYIIPRLQHRKREGIWTYSSPGIGFVLKAERQRVGRNGTEGGGDA